MKTPFSEFFGCAILLGMIAGFAKLLLEIIEFLLPNWGSLHSSNADAVFSLIAILLSAAGVFWWGFECQKKALLDSAKRQRESSI